MESLLRCGSHNSGTEYIHRSRGFCVISSGCGTAHSTQNIGWRYFIFFGHARGASFWFGFSFCTGYTGFVLECTWYRLPHIFFLSSAASSRGIYRAHLGRLLLAIPHNPAFKRGAAKARRPLTLR